MNLSQRKKGLSAALRRQIARQDGRCVCGTTLHPNNSFGTSDKVICGTCVMTLMGINVSK
jgi:hypothetical protein